MTHTVINKVRRTLNGVPAVITVYRTKTGSKYTTVRKAGSKSERRMSSMAPDRWVKFKWNKSLKRKTSKKTKSSRRKH